LGKKFRTKESDLFETFVPICNNTKYHNPEESSLLLPNYNQQDLFIDLFISTDPLHVSGGSSAHHQEHINVHTASGIVN
jgi:hypothetical protein